MRFLKKAKKKEYNKAALPKHVAIIMDGNGRWAKKRSLPALWGTAPARMRCVR